MSCHVDSFLLMEMAAFVFNPERGGLPGLHTCTITKAFLRTVAGLASAGTKNTIRDDFWKDYLVHPHAEAYSRMDDVEVHVRTYSGVYPDSPKLPPQLQAAYTTDRWITYMLHAECVTAECSYQSTQRVMKYALELPDLVHSTVGTSMQEVTIHHGILRAIMQSSSVCTKCPFCKSQTSVLRTKLIETITLPTRLTVGFISTGKLATTHPPETIQIGTREYYLIGVALKNSGHYQCNVIINGVWYNYCDDAGSPRPTLSRVTGPSFRPSIYYGRRILYYSLRAGPSGPGPQLEIPRWMAVRGGPEGDSGVEEVVDLLESDVRGQRGGDLGACFSHIC